MRLLEWVERMLMLVMMVLLQWWWDLRELVLVRCPTTIMMDLLGLGLRLLVCELVVSKHLRQWLRLLLLEVELVLLGGEREWRTHRGEVWELEASSTTKGVQGGRPCREGPVVVSTADGGEETVAVEVHHSGGGGVGAGKHEVVRAWDLVLLLLLVLLADDGDSRRVLLGETHTWMVMVNMTMSHRIRSGRRPGTKTRSKDGTATAATMVAVPHTSHKAYKSTTHHQVSTHTKTRKSSGAFGSTTARARVGMTATAAWRDDRTFNIMFLASVAEKVMVALVGFVRAITADKGAVRGVGDNVGSEETLGLELLQTVRANGGTAVLRIIIVVLIIRVLLVILLIGVLTVILTSTGGTSSILIVHLTNIVRGRVEFRAGLDTAGAETTAACKLAAVGHDTRRRCRRRGSRRRHGLDDPAVMDMRQRRLTTKGGVTGNDGLKARGHTCQVHHGGRRRRRRRIVIATKHGWAKGVRVREVTRDWAAVVARGPKVGHDRLWDGRWDSVVAGRSG